MDNQKWGIIINPKAGNKKFHGKRSVEEKMIAAGIEGAYVYTEYAGHATQIVQDMVKNGLRRIVAVGGDGSINEVLNGLMTSCVDSKELTLGLIPRGTGNDWARYWGIKPRETMRNIRRLQEGKSVRIDIGELHYYHKRAKEIRYFINSVGIGFDARVVEQAEKWGKLMPGMPFSYTLALLSSTLTHRAKNIVLTGTDEALTLNGKVYSLSVANGPYTGGGIKQTPKAVPTDGLLDVMAATTPTNLKQLAKGLGNFISQKMKDEGMVHTFQTKSLKIETPSRLKIEADGIVQKDGKQPITICLHPQALNMII